MTEYHIHKHEAEPKFLEFKDENGEPRLIPISHIEDIFKDGKHCILGLKNADLTCLEPIEVIITRLAQNGLVVRKPYIN